jgi:hypothetical protein
MAHEQQVLDRPATPTLLSWEVLRIAHQDAEKAYRDLSPYRIAITLEPDGWHIDYDFKEPGIQGGGPHYVIDAASGVILRKWYEQ